MINIILFITSAIVIFCILAPLSLISMLLGLRNGGGLKEHKNMENDASLSGNSVAHGSVDSTLGWPLPELKSGESTRVHY